MRGCTKRSTGSVQVSRRRRIPSASPRTEATGPTTMTARWRVGTANSSSWTSSGPSRGSGNAANPAPTGSSISAGSRVRVAALRTSTRPTARSPTTTRRDARSSVTSYCERPAMKPTAASSTATQKMAATMSSCQPNHSPAHQAASATAARPQPSPPITEVTGRAWSRTKRIVGSARSRTALIVGSVRSLTAKAAVRAVACARPRAWVRPSGRVTPRSAARAARRRRPGRGRARRRRSRRRTPPRGRGSSGGSRPGRAAP